MPPVCRHYVATIEPSWMAREVEYAQPPPEKLIAATTPSGRAPDTRHGAAKMKAMLPPTSLFPPPLVLPEDELALDPKQEGQSLRSWNQTRNKVTSRRRTIYVVAPPVPAKDADFIKEWAKPQIRNSPDRKFILDETATPDTQPVKEYLEAFYHGLPVKMLQKPRLEFTKWAADPSYLRDNGLKSPVLPKHGGKPISSIPGSVGIRNTITHDITQIRCRRTPSRDDPNEPRSPQPYPAQLNLNDLLDVCIDAIPSDAYALIMLTAHDLYEDEEDDFCCGRAYGGSRVCVVSMARYNPCLDDLQGIDQQHPWPASHCRKSVEKRCEEQQMIDAPSKDVVREMVAARKKTAIGKSTAIMQALAQVRPPPGSNVAVPVDSPTESWLHRVCKTASHELGHCFGIGHCVYYSCIMQGTASIKEDHRQPPYLCPVDEAKVLTALGSDERDRSDAIIAFCKTRGSSGSWGALEAWTRVRQGRTQARKVEPDPHTPQRQAGADARDAIMIGT